jgi:hypothetical protein
MEALRSRAAAAFLLGVAWVAARPAAAGPPSPPTYTVVAQSGQPAPGSGATYNTLFAPSLNPSGQVAFYGTLSGPSANIDDNAALFAGAPAAPGLVARNGDAAPTLPAGVRFGDLLDGEPPRFNADGHVAFGASLVGGPIPAGPGVYSYWLGSAGNVQPVILEQSLPTLAHDLRFPLQRPVLAAGDRLAWASNNGVYVRSPADPDPQAPAGSAIEQPALNPNGALAVLAAVEGPPTGALAVLVGPPGDLRPVATSGDPVSGAPAGTAVGFPLYPSVNAAGRTAFHGYIRTDPSGPVDTPALFVGSPGLPGGGFQVVARAGDPAPGGLTYSFIIDIDEYRPPAISGAGEVVFNSGGPVASGLFAGTPGNVRLVARSGQHAANAPPGLDVQRLDGTGTYTINSRGQVAFLDYSDTTPTGHLGLYVADPDGSLTLLAAVGYPFDLGPGDSRTVSDIRFGLEGTATGGEDGRPFAFNDAGQVAFALRFTDGTSAVVLTTVPEPCPIAAVGLAALALFRRRTGRPCTGPPRRAAGT